MFSKLRSILTGKSKPVIPVVRMQGTISTSSPMRTNTLNLASVALNLEKAFSQSNAPAVAILVNSPGGAPTQSHFIYQRIRHLAEEHETKVLVFVEDVAASGGYMIALAGDEIFVDPNSIVGSIGVVSSGFGFVDAIAKLGIERRVYTAGANKSMLDPFVPEKAEDVEYLKKLQLELHDSFIGMVKERRGNTLTTEEELFDGKFWVGSHAVNLGLADHIGELRTVIKDRYGEKAKLKLIGSEPTFFKKKLGVKLSVDDLAADLGHGIISAATERLMWSKYGL